MSRDRKFLESRGWKTRWIEFTGGHSFAPEEVYQEAADWLASQFSHGAADCAESLKP